MYKRVLVPLAILAVSVSLPASANQDLDNFYVGGGIANNSLGEPDAIGYQFFGGYDFGAVLGEASVMTEVGYWDSGDFDDGFGRASATGLWANGVVSLPIGGQWSLLGRAGLDFGDDDGLMVGAGVAHRPVKQFELRGEIVTREHIDSFQFNALYRF